MRVYHGTNEEAYQTILNEGFQILPNIKRRFGDGIYFSEANDVDYYGANVIEAELNGNILTLTYDDWDYLSNRYIREHGNDFQAPLVQKEIIEKGYQVLKVNFHYSSSEVIVYDLSAINILS